MRPGSHRKLTLSTARISPRFLSWKRLDRPRASIMGKTLAGCYLDRVEKRLQFTTRGAGKCYGKRGHHPLWQLGHCLASNLSGVTRNMLLHWIQTRWMTGLTTAPGWSGLLDSAGREVAVFSDACSVDMAGF